MMQMRFFLNERAFQMEEVVDNEIFKAGGLYLLEFRNLGMGMMQMAHPLHMHGGQYQVIKRTPAAGRNSMMAALKQGLTDEGWKDTALIFPGETVQLLMKFPDYKGLFLYHCHILEHEDLGMMRNYRVI
jgi:FtsP/CotA-like multicopper oxidase with cupredoxin domain